MISPMPMFGRPMAGGAPHIGFDSMNTQPPPETFELTRLSAADQSLVDAAEQGLVTRLGIGAAAVKPVGFEHVTFSNSSLGIQEQGEGYADDMEPGYSVKMEAGGHTYEFNARQAGDGKYAELPEKGFAMYFAPGPSGIYHPVQYEGPHLS